MCCGFVDPNALPVHLAFMINRGDVHSGHLGFSRAAIGSARRKDIPLLALTRGGGSVRRPSHFKGAT